MASANPGKLSFIAYKLTFLNDQRDRLINAIGLYVSRMVAEGESWSQGGDNPAGYQELCRKIDTAVEFLCEKCEELAGRVAANPRSSEQPGLKSQSLTPTSTAAASTTSYRQHTSSPAPTTTTSYRQSPEPSRPEDDSQLRSLLAKIAVIEEAMYSLRSKTDKVAKQQSGIEEQLEGVLTKVAESDKKNSSRFKQVKQQINDTQSTMEQEHKTSVQRLEKQLQKISAEQNKLKVKVESQAETVEKLARAHSQVVCVKENVDAIEERIDKIILDCDKRHEEIDAEMRDLAGKVMANTEQLLSEGQVETSTSLSDLETRLQALETGGGTTVKAVQKQAERTDQKFRIMCQIVSDRLRPLEQLRASLNEQASRRQDNVKKLSQVLQDVADMSPRLHQLEMNSPRPSCGFSAQTWFTGEVALDTIKQYKIKFSNVGRNFNADTGIFTAPVDGLYVACISLCLSENEELQVVVKHKHKSGHTSGASVCESSAALKGTTSCGMGVVAMKAGDAIFTCVNLMDENDHDKMVFFSCFLLG